MHNITFSNSALLNFELHNIMLLNCQVQLIWPVDLYRKTLVGRMTLEQHHFGQLVLTLILLKFGESCSKSLVLYWKQFWFSANHGLRLNQRSCYFKTRGIIMRDRKSTAECYFKCHLGWLPRY